MPKNKVPKNKIANITSAIGTKIINIIRLPKGASERETAQPGINASSIGLIMNDKYPTINFPKNVKLNKAAANVIKNKQILKNTTNG